MFVSKQQIIAALSQIKDPELDFSIVELGLVYDVRLDEAEDRVQIVMTLTTPACPLQEHFRQAITKQLMALSGVQQVEVVFTFEPAWSLAKASDEVKQQLVLLGIPLSR